MIIYILAEQGQGKRELADTITPVLKNAIILSEQKKEALEGYKSAKDDADIVVIDEGVLFVDTDGEIADIADMVIFGKLNDPAILQVIKSKFNFSYLENGEFVILPNYDTLSGERKDQLFANYIVVDVGNFMLIKTIKEDVEEEYSLDQIALDIETGNAFEEFVNWAVGEDIDLMSFLTDPEHIKVEENSEDHSLCISLTDLAGEIHPFHVEPTKWEKKTE